MVAVALFAMTAFFILVKGAASRMEDLPYSLFHHRPIRRPMLGAKINKQADEQGPMRWNPEEKFIISFANSRKSITFAIESPTPVRRP